MILADEAAAEVAAAIADAGNAVSVNGTIASTAIIDERPAELRRVMPELLLEAHGRHGIFYFTPTDPDPAIEIRTIDYDDQRWTPQPTKLDAFGNVSVLRAVLATAGGTR